jgi:ribosomal protein L37E
MLDMDKSDLFRQLNPFAQLHAVVLDHEMGSGQRVVWSKEHQGWLRNRDWAQSLDREFWIEEPGLTFGRPDNPIEAQLSAAVDLAQRVVRSESTWFCQRCGQTAPELHFICPNIYCEPEIYCVEVPSYGVVESHGGNGQVKHWGSPYGCQSVDVVFDSGYVAPYIGPRALYPFGRPLPANDVITREWCSRCSGAAYNVRDHASRTGESELDAMRKEAEVYIKHAARQLLRYFGDA